jgi:hypothetical protein
VVLVSQKFPKYLKHKTKLLGIDVECFVFGIIATYLTSIIIDFNKVLLFMCYLMLSMFVKATVERGLFYKLAQSKSEMDIDV